ncbi:MAG: flagellar basal-body rod protein FlgF [Alphaproteobacteria bacterium]
MENSIYLALSKQLVQQTNMQIIANNVANANTAGFRAQNIIFEEFLVDPRGKTTDDAAGDPLSFVYNRAQYENTSPGSLSQTGNPLDAALVGPGFFGIQGPGGEVMYSRAGQFNMDADGTLRNSAGFPVADQGGSPIIIPRGSSEIKIDGKGVISNQNGPVGQMMVVEFDDPQVLEAQGNTLYSAPEPGRPAENTAVRQGHIEGSNVQPVVEMTRMIETLRNFQATQRVLQGENERLRTTIRKLTQQQ